MHSASADGFCIGMAVFGVIGGVGRTIGPLVGAFFSEPAVYYPSVFKHTIFEAYPYALPSVILALNCAAVMVMAYFMLQETLVIKRKNLHQENRVIDVNEANQNSQEISDKLELWESPRNSGSMDSCDNDVDDLNSTEPKQRHFFDEDDIEDDTKTRSKKMREFALEMISLGSRGGGTGQPSKQRSNGYTSLPMSSDEDLTPRSKDDNIRISPAEIEVLGSQDVENPMVNQRMLATTDNNDTEETKVAGRDRDNSNDIILPKLRKKVSFSARVSVATIDSDSPPLQKNLKSVSLELDKPLSPLGPVVINSGMITPAELKLHDEELGTVGQQQADLGNEDDLNLLIGYDDKPGEDSDLFPKHLRFDNGSSTIQLKVCILCMLAMTSSNFSLLMCENS
jgi:hypothetical protein